jgi:hypothetical protein
MALKFRRGTTAQQSGSLAYGEPYVNTDLGTLLVGGASGDIQLSNTGPTSTFAGASVSASTFVSASTLKVTGNASIDGNLTLGGAITIGDATADTVNVIASLSSSLIPQTTNAFDLGSATKVWRDLYISTGSIKFVEGTTVVKTLSPTTLTALESKTGSYASTGSNTFINTQYITGGLEVYKVSNPDIKLINGTTGIGYHIQNGDGGHLQVHNSTNDKLLFLFTSASSAEGNQNATFYGGLNVSQSILANRLDATRIFTNSISASVITGSIAATNGVVSGSSQIVGILSSLNTTTASFSPRIASLESATASLFIDTNNLETFSSSTLTRLSRIEESTASLNSLTSSYARTNTANVFTATQTISGSLYVTQDLVVQGSSSIQTISSSRLDIGDNIIQLNVNSPSLRFGGLAINDSGSAGSSGSFLYDSVEDEFIFVHKGNGTNVTSSHFVLGPETYDNLGNEIYMTQNRIPKVTNYEHLGDSNITDTGTLITLGSNTVVTGTLLASGTALVSGSAQIDHNSTTNYVANKHIDHTSVQISAGNGLSGGGDISSTRTLTLDTTSVTFTTGVKSKLDVDGVISGSKTITIAGTSTALGSSITAEQIRTAIGTVVTGSSQIVGSSITTNTVTVGSTAIALGGSATTIAGLSSVSSTGFTGALTGNASTATTLATARNINGTSFNGSADITIANLVSGSGQVAIASTSGFGTYINQAVLTTSSPTFAGLTINGAITATGDITAYFTSDIRHKNNVELIDNALDKVNALNGVTWEWNDDVDEVTKQTPKTGLIAQDVLDVLPEVVKTRENGFLALDYSKMVGLLVEAIKEQDIVIQKLKSDMVGLNNTITVFEDRMKEKGLL